MDTATKTEPAEAKRVAGQTDESREPDVIQLAQPEPSDGALAAPVAPPAEPSVGYLVQLGIERGLDPEALKTMMSVYERLKDRDAKAEFDAAMAAFQAECPQTPKTSTATIVSKRTSTKYTYTYAPMDVIAKTIGPHLHKHGLSYTFDSAVSQDGGFLKATCIVQHESGHSQTSSFTCPIDTADKDPRKYGIARTYACRYAIIQGLGLSSADPDPDGTPASAAADNLSAEQLAEIKDLLDKTKADAANFLEAVAAPSLDAIPAGAFQLARSMLHKRWAKQVADEKAAKEEPTT